MKFNPLGGEKYEKDPHNEYIGVWTTDNSMIPNEGSRNRDRRRPTYRPALWTIIALVAGVIAVFAIGFGGGYTVGRSSTETTMNVKSPPYEEMCDHHNAVPTGVKDLSKSSSHGNITELNGMTAQVAESTRYGSCEDIKKANGASASGVYIIYPTWRGEMPMRVRCDMETDGGGWMVIQRRTKGCVYFYRDWSSYEDGFGDADEEFWIGNTWLNQVTCVHNHELRFDLWDFNNEWRFAAYDRFHISSPEDNYRITVGTYQPESTAGDSFSGVDGYAFSTYDRENDVHPYKNCAILFKGAWWYSNCHSSNLNGLYLGGVHATYADGMEWYLWTGHYYSLKATEMKIRRTDF